MTKSPSAIVHDIIEDVTNRLGEVAHVIAEIVIEPKYLAGYKDGKLKFLSENLFLVHTIQLKEIDRVTSVTKINDSLLLACTSSEEGHFLHKIDPIKRDCTGTVRLPYSTTERDIHVSKLSSDFILLAPFGGKHVDVWDVALDHIVYSTEDHQEPIYTKEAPAELRIISENIFMTGDVHEIRLWDLANKRQIKKLERRREELPRGMIKMNNLLIELYSCELDVWDLNEGIVLYRVPCKENLSSLVVVGSYVCALRVEKLLTQVFVFDPENEFKLKKTVEVLLNAEERPPRLVPIPETQVALVGDEGIHVIDVMNDSLVKEWTVLGHYGKNITDEFIVKKHFVLEGDRILVIHASVEEDRTTETLVLFSLSDDKLHYDTQEKETQLACITHL